MEGLGVIGIEDSRTVGQEVDHALDHGNGAAVGRDREC